MIDDPPEEPFLYRECYAAGDPDHPGPAAHFGEDVCVEYEGMSSHFVQYTDNDAGTTDVQWALFQVGTASVRALPGPDVSPTTGYGHKRGPWERSDQEKLSIAVPV